MSEEVTTEEVTTEEVVETPVEESNTQPESFVGSMLSQIEDDEVKEAGFWKNLEGKDATEVGKYIKELQSFAGKKGDIPKPDATEEEWAEFYSKLGRPESTDGYDFTVGDEFRELVGEDSAPFFEKAVEGFKEQAYAMGASSEKAEELVDWYLGMVAQEIEESNTAMKEADEAMDKELRGEWGDGYDGMMNGITAMLKANGMPEENLQFAIDSGLLRDPAFATTLANIATRFQDDPEIGQHQTSTMAGLTDQIFDVETEIKGYIKRGEKIPVHILEKRNTLGEKQFRLKENR